jgi:hypothetical protein
LFLRFLLDLFMGLKELTYVTRDFLGYLVQFTTSLFYVLIKGNPLLYCSNSSYGGGERVNLQPLCHAFARGHIHDCCACGCDGRDINRISGSVGCLLW